jgi:hypothetical protein
MRMTKTEREAAEAEGRAWFERRSKIWEDLFTDSEEHVCAFIKQHYPNYDPNETSEDDLPSWLHQFVIEAEENARTQANKQARAATEQIRAVAEEAAMKAEKETYAATFKRVFHERTAEAIAKREGRWVYDESNNHRGRVLRDHETLVDGVPVTTLRVVK